MARRFTDKKCFEPIKPCPFCGEKPETSKVGAFHSIQCANPDCWIQPNTDQLGSIAEAAWSWNNRKFYTDTGKMKKGFGNA